MEDTARTRALNYTRINWKVVAAYLVAAVSTLVNVSIALGHKQADGTALVEKVESLASKVDGLSSKVSTQSESIAGMKATVDMIHEDVTGVKAWKDRVTGVAETVTVPKLQSHRARKP